MGNRYVTTIPGIALAIVFIASSVLLNAQAIDRMVFTTNSGGPNRVWDSDSVELSLQGSLLQITGYMPTGDNTRPIQTLTMKVRNFDGGVTFPRTYQFTEGDGSWQNYAGTSGFCNCKSGSITITKIDTNSRLQATFNVSCQTLFPSGNLITTHITEGVVSGVIPIQLKVKVKPGDQFTAKPKDSVTLSLTVVNSATDKPVADATVTCTDNPILIKFNIDLGKTDANGQLKYTFTVPESMDKKDTFELKFIAKKNKALDAPIVTQKIEIEPNNRYFYYKCGGIPIIEYDAGEGEQFEKVGAGSPLIKASGISVTINRFLKWEGDEFQIDTTPGAERVFYTGKLLCPDCKDAGLVGGLFLEAESFILTSVGPNCDGLMKLASSKQTGLKFLGIALKLDEVAFLPGFENPGIRIKLVLESEVGNDLSAQCAKSNDPGHRNIAGAFNWRKNGFEKVELSAQNLGVGKAFCFNELAASYDFAQSLLNIAARATFEEVVDKSAEIKTSISIRSDTVGGGTNVYLKDFMLQATSEANCYPVPPQPEFCIKGFRINAGFDNEKGVRKWNFGLTGIFKLTPEAVAAGKFAWVKKWGDALGAEKPELCEFELGGKWEYPAKFSGKGLMKIAKIPYISVTKPWQVQFDATQTLDFTQGLTGRGNAKICHLGADDFFASLSDVGYNITFNPYDFSVSGKGALRIPVIGTELNENGAANFLRWVRSFNIANISLGQGDAYLGINEKDGFHTYITCDVSQHPIAFIRSYGKLFVDVKMNSQDGLFVDWGDAYSKVAVRRLLDPSGEAGKKQGAFIQAAPLDTFAITPDVERFFVMISGVVGSPAPSSTLFAPNGASYVETTTDSSVIKFTSDNGELVQWVVKDPADGDWKLQLLNPKPEDEVRFSAIRTERPFEITTAVNGRSLTITWNGNGYGPNDRVSLILDDDEVGFNGIPIGTADAALGTFTYELSDTLPMCSYYVGASRAAQGYAIATDYSNFSVSTGKTILAPPGNVQVVMNTTDGLTQVTWTPSPDPNVVAYIIMADIVGEDTALAYAERFETHRLLPTIDMTGRGIYMVAVNEENLRGCPSPTTQTIVGVDEEEQPQPGNQHMLVVPNPAETSAIVYVWHQASEPIQVRIVNTLGQEVLGYVITTPQESMAQATVDLTGLPSGLYYVVATQSGASISTPLVIRQ